MAKKRSAIDDSKIEEAKKKVNDLLKGTGLEEPEPIVQQEEEVISPVADEDRASVWLNAQVTALTQQVEELEGRLVLVQQENNLLKSGGEQQFHSLTESEADRNKIIEMYKHFENVYTGRNKYGTPYGKVALSNPQFQNGLLDVMLQTFPYLQQVKQYKHWGGNE